MRDTSTALKDQFCTEILCITPAALIVHHLDRTTQLLLSLDVGAPVLV